MAIFTAPASIWEKESFFAQRDVIIIGAGLSGLWSAFYLKKKHPNLSVTILERGLIPTGASTRNAGFACFGSLTELVHDRALFGDLKTLELVTMRYQGLKRIMETFNPAEIDFTLCGGYELIRDSDTIESIGVIQAIKTINQLLAPVLSTAETFSLADHKIAAFGFAGLRHLVESPLEGYLHSGKLCQALLQRVQALGVTVFMGTNVEEYTQAGSKIIIRSHTGHEFTASSLLVCTNAFATHLLPSLDVVPARGQMLLTSEIPGLPFRGTFHADEGFYYFRNLGGRVLLGGARNTDISGETSLKMETTGPIQEALENFLKKTIIPGIDFTITDRWSGIMAMGSEKMPIVREVENRVFCAVRMSGMGVALTPVIGEIIADKICE
jgi:gamma-glutamylputrescine oxidase